MKYKMHCDECNRVINRSVVRIAYMKSRKDLSGKKQWSTVKSKHVCQMCWGKFWASKDIKVM